MNHRTVILLAAAGWACANEKDVCPEGFVETADGLCLQTGSTGDADTDSDSDSDTDADSDADSDADTDADADADSDADADADSDADVDTSATGDTAAPEDGPIVDAASDGGDGLPFGAPGGVVASCPGDTPMHATPWVSQKIVGNDWSVPYPGNMCCGPAVMTSIEASEAGNLSPGDSDLQATIDWMDATLSTWTDNPTIQYQCDPLGTDTSEMNLVARDRLGLVGTTLYTDWCALKDLLATDNYVVIHVDSQGSNSTDVMLTGSSHWMLLEGVSGGYAFVDDPGRTFASDGDSKGYTEDSVADSFARRGGLAILVERTGTCIGDGDGDGYGAAPGCLDTDCSDLDPDVHPGAAESCDGIDSDCDGSLVDGDPDFDLDLVPDCSDGDDDGDGDPDGTDCDDADAAVHNGAGEIACNGVDDDCAGGDICAGPDADGDGDPDASDCNDADSSVYTGAPEGCDGVDDNCDGVVDEPASCWVAVYRFEDAATGAKCWNTDVTPPATCGAYAFDIEAWIVPSTAAPGTFDARQCSLLTDHILVENGSADYNALVAAGYDCTVSLGHPYGLGMGPSASVLPFGDKCELYRFSFATPGGGSHLFTRGGDSLVGTTCEPPARAEVLTDFTCFTSPPAGC